MPGILSWRVPKILRKNNCTLNEGHNTRVYVNYKLVFFFVHLMMGQMWVWHRILFRGEGERCPVRGQATSLCGSQEFISAKLYGSQDGASSKVSTLVLVTRVACFS